MMESPLSITLMHLSVRGGQTPKPVTTPLSTRSHAFSERATVTGNSHFDRIKKTDAVASDSAYELLFCYVAEVKRGRSMSTVD